MVVNVAKVELGFAVRLGERVVRTPKGNHLCVPTQALAELIAKEWSARGLSTALTMMPATRLAHGTVDAFPAVRRETVERIVEFAGHDQLCYIADGPEALVERQSAAWTPLIEWAGTELNLSFVVTRGIIHRDQPASTLGAVRDLALSLCDFRLAGAALAAQLLGSSVLAFALMKQRLTGAEAFAASMIDETWQAEIWGKDADATRRSAAIAAEIGMLDTWFRALA